MRPGTVPGLRDWRSAVMVAVPARESYPLPPVPTLASGRTWQYAGVYELQGE
jgi:hypothetical protein